MSCNNCYIRNKYYGVLKRMSNLCKDCDLHNTRTNVLFDKGSFNGDLFLLGGYPSQEDDSSGIVFSNKDGELLESIVTKGLGMNKEDIYLTNLIKCLPNGEVSKEQLKCTWRIREQIAIVKPKVLVTMGKEATETLIKDKTFKESRGTFNTWEGYKVFSIIDIRLLNYSEDSAKLKLELWEDLQKLMIELRGENV